MASEPPKRIQTLGRIAGKEYDSGITFEEALYMTQGHCISQRLPVPIARSMESGETALADFPFVEGSPARLHQFVDIVHPYTETHDLKEVEKLFMANRYNDLPGSFGLKGNCPVPYTMQTSSLH